MGRGSLTVKEFRLGASPTGKVGQKNKLVPAKGKKKEWHIKMKAKEGGQKRLLLPNQGLTKRYYSNKDPGDNKRKKKTEYASQETLWREA